MSAVDEDTHGTLTVDLNGACPCGMRPVPIEVDGVLHRAFSAAWRRAHRDQHLARFPNLDRVSRINLDDRLREAEAREAAEAMS